jgi:hypothetical protein
VAHWLSLALLLPVSTIGQDDSVYFLTIDGGGHIRAEPRRVVRGMSTFATGIVATGQARMVAPRRYAGQRMSHNALQDQ